MKKFLTLILLCGHLYALDIPSTLKTYHEILSAMVPGSRIGVYTLNRELRDVFVHSEKLIVKQDAGHADIVIVTTEPEYEKIKEMLEYSSQEKQPIIFATTYHLLKYHSDVIGALYWRKGRSQLLFIRPRVRKLGIVLPSKFEPYSIESL
jgi:hypothetical protein